MVAMRKGGKAGVVHRPMRFLHGCGQHWWIVGGRLSVCVRVYQHLSCLLLRCAGCLLTALPRLPHIIQLRANLERKQKPTHCSKPTPNPYNYSTHPYTHTHLFLTKFTCYILQFLELHPSTHLSTTLFTWLEGIWAELLLNCDAVHSSKVTILRLLPSMHHSSYN